MVDLKLESRGEVLLGGLAVCCLCQQGRGDLITPRYPAGRGNV